MTNGHEFEPTPKSQTPQGVWKSLYQDEEPGMEMKLSTDQLCAVARFRERENVWFQWIAPLACLAFGAFFVHRVIQEEQLWLRLAPAWMAVLMAAAFVGAVRVGARRIRTGESCAQFMIREVEGSRRSLLAGQWGAVLILPSLLMSWWGVYGAIQANGLQLDPASWRYHLLTSPWRIVAVAVALLAFWVVLGREARKRARQAEELRRAIGVEG